MAVVAPLLLLPHLQDLLDLQDYHFGVFVARVQHEQGHTVYDVAVGLAIEDSDDPACSPVQVVEGGLGGSISTVYWLAK